MLLANFNRKEHLRHRAVSLRQHGFLVILCKSQNDIHIEGSKTSVSIFVHNNGLTLQRIRLGIRYDTIECLTWTRKLSIQLYLAHVARKETKTNNASAPLIQYRLRSVKSVREPRKASLRQDGVETKGLTQRRLMQLRTPA